MTPGREVFIGATLFDGTALHQGQALVVEGGRVTGIGPPPRRGPFTDLGGGTLAPGFLDLQVNGGGGAMVDGTATAESLATLCAVHARLGATGILPTLISDTVEATARVIAAGIAAVGAPGFLGLYLEGPHLDPLRKGAHDAAHLRPMTDDDLARLVAAAASLPNLMVTLAPEAASLDRIRALRRAGVIVSLGHSDCTHAVARSATAAGATCATHLFNAMRGLGHREPGLAGAVLDGGGFAGVIADGIHVHPAALRIALAAKPAGLFLVTDSMACAGTRLSEITLGGRRILRRDARLTLEDGTLAGADLDMAQAVAMLTGPVGLSLERALSMATSVPAAVLTRAGTHGHLRPGSSADMVHLAPDGRLVRVWRGGVPLAPPA